MLIYRCVCSYLPDADGRRLRRGTQTYFLLKQLMICVPLRRLRNLRPVIQT